MINSSKPQLVRRAAIAYCLTGLGFLIFGFPFWFLGATDHLAKGTWVLPFLYVVDELFPSTFNFWLGPVSFVIMFIGADSLRQAGEPVETSRRGVWLVPLAGAIVYFLSTWMPLPFAPLGAFLNGVGMILVGVASLKSRIWTGWRRYAPLVVGSFPFVFMFPLVLLTGARPPAMIGLWGIPWLLLGIAAGKQAKESRSIRRKEQVLSAHETP